MLSASILLALAASVTAQGVTSAIAPSAPIPSGCSTSTSGTFQITVVNVTQTVKKRELEKRDALVLTLANGILKDAQGRTGYIASNYQFQFDGPPQVCSSHLSAKHDHELTMIENRPVPFTLPDFLYAATSL
jgi:hypothetical protein